MFELYNAHLRAKPAQGSRYVVKLLALGGGTVYFSPDLPPYSVFKFKPGRGRDWVQARTDRYGHFADLFGFNTSHLGEVFELYLVDESELNSD